MHDVAEFLVPVVSGIEGWIIIVQVGTHGPDKCPPVLLGGGRDCRLQLGNEFGQLCCKMILDVSGGFNDSLAFLLC